MNSVFLYCGESKAEVSLFGGMTTVDFAVNSRIVSPLYRSNWSERVEDRFLRELRGDFFCLPFGITPANPIPDWENAYHKASSTEYPHGFSANAIYEVVELMTDEVTIRLDYNDSKVDYITRTVKLYEDFIAFTDTVYAKSDFSAPVGLHPIFNIPQSPKSCEIEITGYKKIFTYPIPVDESSIFQRGVTFEDITQVPLKAGGVADARWLPLGYQTEELLLLTDVTTGECALINRHEGYKATLSWDCELLNHCMLWYSNMGRQFPPWNGENLCLGIEPVTSAFDLGEGISLSENPLNKNGFKTAINFHSNQPRVFKHKITVQDI